VNKKPLLCIFGPTASGKTGLAVALAKQVDGEVINCDAMQMYADLPRLTAQPDMAERDGVPHHLFGVLNGNDKSQVARYLELARPILADIRARGKQPILCGGTGMYFKALTEGLAQVPPIPIVLHEMVVAQHKDIGGAAMRQKLMEIDPETAERLKDGDTQRLIRAMEVFVATGTPVSTWLRETHDTKHIESDWQAIVLLPPRDALYKKINGRFEIMMQQGAVDEVRTMLAKNYSADMPVMRAHGVPEISKLLSGEWDEAKTVSYAQQITRNYAKRQVTWFTHQLLGKYPQHCIAVDDFGGSVAALRAVGTMAKL
jgi:tRNA dimethylallyltransferase